MRFRSRLVFVILLVAVVVLVVVVVSLLPHGARQMETNPNVPMPIGLPINASLNSPIYVIGPQSLTQGLVGVGVPQSLIRPIGLGQLSSLPGNSTVIIDYSVIEPSVVVGVVKGRVGLNLTSPVIDLLTSLITKGDLVMLYGNSSDLPIMEYLLAYAWARRYGVLNSTRWGGPGKPSDYLIAYPEIPVGGDQALAVAFGGPHYLVIGPVIPSELAEAVAMYGVLRYPPPLVSFLIGIARVYYPDLCYFIYEWYYSKDYYSSGEFGGNNYFIWTYPITSSPSYPEYGVAGYSDGNGTFYYDTCLEVGNQVWATATPPNIPAYVYGFVGYEPTTTMIDNGGKVLVESGDIDYYYSYKLYPSYYNSLFGSPLNGYSPDATNSQESSYYIISMEFEYEITLPSSETISVTLSPMASGIDNIAEDNVTWTFNLNNANTNNLYANAIEDTSPAIWILPNYSSGTQYETQLPIRFSTKVMTSSQIAPIEYTPCNYYNNTYEYIWVNASWVLVAQPTQSSTTNLNGAFYGFYQQEPGTYVSGVTSWSILEPSYCS
jgi:hypothetical protein